MISPRSLRVAAAATFLPAFPLLLVHGVLSHDAVPAVGLVPLWFSASSSVFLFVRESRRRRGRAQQANGASPPPLQDGGEEEAAQHNGNEDEEREGVPPERPILVFVADAVLAAALLVVLVFTWMRTESGRNISYSMLAAYGTMPLLVNFCIHLYLAVRAFYLGLAVQNLIQYVAWQAVDPECPNCSHRLRPEAPPALPWLASLPSAREVCGKMRWPASWKTPAWLKNGRGGYSPLSASGTAEPDHPYTDDEPAGEGASAQPPAPVEVVGKKDKKGKNASVMGEEPTPWDS